MPAQRSLSLGRGGSKHGYAPVPVCGGGALGAWLSVGDVAALPVRCFRRDPTVLAVCGTGRLSARWVLCPKPRR